MKKHNEFSKVLLKQESGLIWIVTIGYLLITFYCIYSGYLGTLPWLAAMVGFPWTAYGVSQAFYYHKSKAENTNGGIKYETALKEIEAKYATANQTAEQVAAEAAQEAESQSYNAQYTANYEAETYEPVDFDENATI